jgi:hypothetical protein
MIKKCCICGKETPDYTALEHNESTKYYYGEILKANGVMITEQLILCDGHIDMVIDIIKRMVR